MKEKNLWISLAAFLLVCFAVQIIGSFWTQESVSTWYPTLIKPSWNPPDWVFGPVWSILYVMIAVAGWLIYRAPETPQRFTALKFYLLQLAFNFVWSFFFFSLRSPILGLIDIVLLSVAITLTILSAWPVRRLASLLLLPYLIWVVYATTLNAAIVVLNQ